MSPYTWMWVAIGVSGLMAWLTKLAGHTVPDAWAAHPRLQRIATLVTVALLAALAALQTFTSGHTIVVDARVMAIGVAVVALLARAPFIVVVALAALTAAALRAAGLP